MNPSLRTRRLRLCADHDVPANLTEAIRDIGYQVLTAAEDGVANLDDRAIIAWVRRKKRVLLSFNHTDFLNDRRHPLQKSPGIIAIAVPNDGAHLPGVATGLDIFLTSFADELPLKYWHEMKVKVMARGYHIKRREGGRVVRYEVREHNNSLYYRGK